MWLFGLRAKLLRRLDRLAFYNDKMIYYAKHTPIQAEAERNKLLIEIKSLAGRIGVAQLPTDFVQAIESGAVSIDASGDYIRQLKAHFRQRNAP